MTASAGGGEASLRSGVVGALDSRDPFSALVRAAPPQSPRQRVETAIAGAVDTERRIGDKVQSQSPRVSVDDWEASGRLDRTLRSER